MEGIFGPRDKPGHEVDQVPGHEKPLVTVYHLQHSLVLDVVLALSLDGCLDDGKNAAGSPRVDDRRSSWLRIHHLGFPRAHSGRSTAEDQG